MNKIVPLIVCLTMAFATIPEVNNSRRGEYVYQQENAIPGVIGIRELSSVWDQDSGQVNVELRFEVGAKVPKTFFFTTEDGGVPCGGTLRLSSIRDRDGGRYAIYTGYVYPLK